MFLFVYTHKTLCFLKNQDRMPPQFPFQTTLHYPFWIVEWIVCDRICHLTEFTKP